MSTTAAPPTAPAVPRATPAELPVAHGQAGATLVLHPLLSAVMRGPRGWFERTGGPTAGLKALGIAVGAEDVVDVPIVAFLLEHPSAGHVLVDTGFARVVADGPSRMRVRNLGRVGQLMSRDLRMRPDQTIASQLQAKGIDPAQVGLIVMTHLHFDHASALCEFPSATVLVSRPEWQAAHARYPFMHGYVPAQLDPRPTYRTFEIQSAPAHGPFEHALDLFGDGSLVLVFTPGHSLGHVSLIARLGDKPALLTGDAAYTLATVREGARPWRAEDESAFERSVAALASWDREHPDALVIPGHDMPAWKRLQDRYS